MLFLQSFLLLVLPEIQLGSSFSMRMSTGYWQTRPLDLDTARPDVSWPGLLCKSAPYYYNEGYDGYLVEFDPALKCARLTLRSNPLLWFQIEDGWYGYDFCRNMTTASATNNPIGVMPHFSAEQVRSTKSISAWARRYGEALLDPDNMESPMRTGGSWQLTHKRIPKHDIETSVCLPRTGYFDLSSNSIFLNSSGHFYHQPVFALRGFSDEKHSGRLKWWRKVVQQEQDLLPPLLLAWNSGLAAHVILDGHDRLQAAYLENADAIDAICLKAVEKEIPDPKRAAIIDEVAQNALLGDPNKDRAQEKNRIEHFNRMLIDAHTPFYFFSRPSHGGPLNITEWREQVVEALQGVDKEDHPSIGLLQSFSKE